MNRQQYSATRGIVKRLTAKKAKTTIEVLDRLRTLLKNESRWVKDDFAINLEGNKVASGDNTACAWCIVGGLELVGGHMKRNAVQALVKTLRQQNKTPVTHRDPQETLMAWNDCSAEHNDVLEVITSTRKRLAA